MNVVELLEAGRATETYRDAARWLLAALAERRCRPCRGTRDLWNRDASHAEVIAVFDLAIELATVEGEVMGDQLAA